MKIYITDDFDPDKIIDSGQCFRPKRLDDGRYRFITGSLSKYLQRHGNKNGRP